MKELKFKNVTIQYDENSVNEKKIKRKNTLLYVLTSVFTIVWIPSSSLIMHGVYKIAPSEGIAMAGSIITLLTTLVLGIWGVSIICAKQFGNAKSEMWLEYMFRQDKIEAGWFNEELWFCTKNKNGSHFYSLWSFMTPIKNEFIINNESDKCGPIHITINITNDEKTVIDIVSI